MVKWTGIIVLALPVTGHQQPQLRHQHEQKKTSFFISLLFYLGFALFVWSLASIISALAQTNWNFKKTDGCSHLISAKGAFSEKQRYLYGKPSTNRLPSLCLGATRKFNTDGISAVGVSLETVHGAK